MGCTLYQLSYCSTPTLILIVYFKEINVGLANISV